MPPNNKVPRNKSTKEVKDYKQSEKYKTWIKEINIHKNVSKIGKEVFRNCKKLENINVSGDNPYYCDVDGVLFNKDVTELYAYTYGKMIKLKITRLYYSPVGEILFSMC